MSIPHVTTKRGRKPGSRTKGKTKVAARRTARRAKPTFTFNGFLSRESASGYADWNQ